MGVVANIDVHNVMAWGLESSTNMVHIWYSSR